MWDARWKTEKTEEKWGKGKECSNPGGRKVKE
jgi:hypothetical protein